ncbi:alpha/beta hydrolase [Gordonia oryzae]|uniref:Alpha/beta hydrolase n=1 Tax=Gordonia oryzae TaxID=2487349 RepID=A0A3N4H621_9ACTN|nr:alpha/beta hydrolase [Gordonia oryzae]
MAAVALGISACAIGPDPGPALVPGGGGSGGQTAPASSSAPTKAPELRAPATDLPWQDCAAKVSDEYGTRPPTGLAVQCATLASPVDADRSQTTLSLALTRITSPTTPADAAPLVLTSGTDMPSSRALLLLASGAGRSLLDTHPVVAVDRRGIPQSTPLDCLTRAARATYADNGLIRGASDDRRIGELASAASDAADSCTETLAPNQLAFGVGAAASDLETLRKRWGVPQLGLIGIGEGSDVVIGYTSLYGGRSGRIVLDTPTPFGANARDAAAAAATGVQAALATFTQRCAALGSACALGSGGVSTIADVLNKGRNGDLGTLSDTQALAGITTGLALAANSPDGIGGVASAIAAADRGDTGALSNLVGQAQSLRLTDGQIVGGCNDVTGPVSRNEIGSLITTWSKDNPLTGTDAALSLMRCSGWSAGEAVTPPSSFPVSPLIIDNPGDPINGGTGADALGALFTRASASPVKVSWNGLGYSALARSSCVADTVADYVASATLGGPAERGCPS